MTSDQFIIRRLGDTDRNAIYQHLIGLSKEDRRLRFCITATDPFIHRYVYAVMNFDRDPTFGAFHEDRLIGLANVVPATKDSCELAFSIEFGYRGTGLARQLMQISIDMCRQLGGTKLCMSCLRENKKMQALAKSFGLDLNITFDEAYAELGITK